MLSFNRWVFSILFLGHLIAGVNREIFNIDASNSIVDGILSKETAKIIYFHHKSNSDERNIDFIDDIFTTYSRQTNTLSSSNKTVCSPLDSCGNRCGKKPRALPYTCNCDSLCTIFSDCCVDYNEHCEHENSTSVDENQSLNISRLGCEILFRKYHVLTVNTCPKDYSDLLSAKMCSSEIPKECVFPEDLNMSNSERVYATCKKTVLRNCMSKLTSRCDVKVEPLCNFIAKKCDRLASNVCRKCNISFWPVLGKDGVIYRNSFCAFCNSQKSDKILTPSILEAKMKQIKEFNLTDTHSMYFARHCVPVEIDSCPEMGVVDDEIQKLCYNHTGAVIAKGRRLIYKNAHCAMCNGETFDNLQCATKTSLKGGLIRPLLDTFITGDVQGVKFDDIPAAFSILLNFGLDGRERMYFSSEREEEMKRNQARCGEGRIWDPFSEVCRKLYCSTEFVLVDYKCVRKDVPVEEIIHENETSVVPDARAEFVHLTLNVEMEMLDFLQFHGQDIETICENARESLANSFSINIERIKDVRFNITVGDTEGLDETLRFIEEMDDLHPITFTLDFDLYEDYAVNITASEPSVDSIVSMLASSLSMNGFELDINNVTSRIFAIHQTVSPLTSWCQPEDGGEKKEYWNSEFSLKLNDDNSTVRGNQIKGIYVNKTGRFYSRGNFIADILFQGYQFSGSLINVSGVAVACDWKKKLNESCLRILIDSEEYSILENGKLSIHNEKLRNIVNDSSYEVTENNSLWVCIKSLKTSGNNKIYIIEMNLVQAVVSYVLLWISVTAMALVLITYSAFGSLRNLPGCNTMNLTFSLMVMQLTFLFGQRNTVTGLSCTVVGHFLHYKILCCFMWMNVMAFDLFRTFGNKDILSNIRSKRKYLPRYMIYAYFSPASVIIIASLLDYFVSESSFAPNYGRNNICWIVNQHSAIVFFAVPLAAIMCINFVFFLLTILAMKSVKSLSQIKDLQTNRNAKTDLILYARMALVIGLTWILSFSAASVRQSELVGQILTYLFIIFNTLQGVFIFWVFVCNKRVFDLYRKAMRNMLRKVSNKAKYEGSSKTISRFSDATKRSRSTNTVVSTVSNASTLSNDSQISTIAE